MPPSGGGLVYWFDSRVRTKLRVLAITVLLCGGFVDAEIAGWSSLSLSEDVDEEEEHNSRGFFSLFS